MQMLDYALSKTSLQTCLPLDGPPNNIALHFPAAQNFLNGGKVTAHKKLTHKHTNMHANAHEHIHIALLVYICIYLQKGLTKVCTI